MSPGEPLPEAFLPELPERYELGEEIGRGGMGTVYRALDRRLGREVAIKVLALLPGLQADPDVLDTAARLEREARILARLEHPGIVPVHDVGLLPDGRVFYTMKLVRGQRLDEVAQAASLPELLRLFTRVLDAVAFAHAQGVVHRDLKPENVMVGPFGEVLVMDWGVAKLRGDWAGEGGGTGGTVLGTPGYMPPEQARGEVARTDERSDVFALGVLLGDLLAASADRSRPEPPRPLAAIRARATAEDPAARYPDVPALAADLARYLDGLAVAAYRESPLERAGRFVRRHRTPILLILAYLAMRVLILIFAGR